MAASKLLRDNVATIVVGVVVICAIVFSFVLTRTPAAREAPLVARIHDSTGTIHELPLSHDGRLAVATDLGSNVIVVEKGAAHMEEADCPRGLCLQQRPISQPGEQLVCLPHKLWVEVVEEGAPSAEMDVNAATTPDDVDLMSH